MKDPDWMLLGEPREVQKEALRRSYGGFKCKDGRDAVPVLVPYRKEPARKWGHLLQMRLGKTPLAFGEFMLFQRDYGVKNLVVLPPNSYKQDWVNEAGKFGVSAPAFAFETSKAHEAENFVKKNPAGWIVAINHEAMQHGKGIRFLQDVLDDKTMLVIDESIRFKNHAANSAMWTNAVAKQAAVLRLLTGLPMSQGPQDLYMQLSMLGATGGRVFHAFRNRYCEMGGFKGKKVLGVKNAEELRATIDSVAFDAKRIDWADPVDATQSILRTQLAPEQSKHYRTMEAEFYAYIKQNEAEITASMVVTKLMKLQQITSGFIIAPDGDPIELMDPMKIPKVLRLIELIEQEIDEGKIVIPYFYQHSGSILERALAKYNPAVIHRQGAMKSSGRDVVSEKARFNNDPSCRVCIVQISSGKYGHDLSGTPGNRTSFMAFYENTFSPDDREQIEARITAATQDWPVNYLDFISSPVEALPIQALQQKMDVITAVFGERGRPRMTEE